MTNSFVHEERFIQHIAKLTNGLTTGLTTGLTNGLLS